MKRYFQIIITMFFIAFLIFGCTKNNISPPAKEKVNNPTPKTYTITAPKAGKIIGLIVEKGERISKGQPLFALADEELTQEYNKVRTELAKQEAKYKVMQTGIPDSGSENIPALAARLEAAQQKATKMNQLLAIGGISRKQAQAAQQEEQSAAQALMAAKQQSASNKPASPEVLAEQNKIIEGLKEQMHALEIKLQANEILCPETSIVKDVLILNNANVTTNKAILILEVATE